MFRHTQKLIKAFYSNILLNNFIMPGSYIAINSPKDYLARLVVITEYLNTKIIIRSNPTI